MAGDDVLYGQRGLLTLIRADGVQPYLYSHIYGLGALLDSIQVSFSISTLNIPSDTSKYGEAASGLVSKTPNRSRWSSCEYNNNGDEHISLARLQNRKWKWLSCISQSKFERWL